LRERQKIVLLNQKICKIHQEKNFLIESIDGDQPIIFIIKLKFFIIKQIINELFVCLLSKNSRLNRLLMQMQSMSKSHISNEIMPKVTLAMKLCPKSHKR